MIKKTLALTLLLSSPLLCQQLHIISNLENYSEGHTLFSSSSPYRILQDASFKNHIQLTCLNKEHSQLYSPDDSSRWMEKIRSWFFEQKEWIQLSSNPKDKLIYFNLPNDLTKETIQKIPADRQILFAFNEESAQKLKQKKDWQSLFFKIYTNDPSLVDDKKTFLLQIPALAPISKDLPPFKQRSGICLVRTQSQPLTQQEKNLINYYTAVAPKQFHIFGDESTLKYFTNYKKDDPASAFASHRFSLCVQTTSYLDESLARQIFSSFSALTIPVIEGSDAIYSFIPKHCFIDKKDFSDEQQLLLYLNSMSSEAFEEYQSRIQTFLQSQDANLFSIETFAQEFLQATNY